METNFWGVANLTLHAMRIMREDNAHAGSAGDGERGPQQQQQGGVIVQVTSMGGFVGYPGSAYYHAAKFAVEGFTESLSREVRPEWNSESPLFYVLPPPVEANSLQVSVSTSPATDNNGQSTSRSPSRLVLLPTMRLRAWSRWQTIRLTLHLIALPGYWQPISTILRSGNRGPNPKILPWQSTRLSVEERRYP